MKCKQPHPGFELESLIPFLMTATITLWVPCYHAATQAGEPSVGYQKISATKLPLTSGYDEPITRTIFRKHLTSHDVDRLLDSTAMRNLGGDSQFQLLPYGLTLGTKKLKNAPII